MPILYVPKHFLQRWLTRPLVEDTGLAGLVERLYGSFAW